MFVVIFFNKRINKIVAYANVMIAYFIQLHIVSMIDVKMLGKL